MWGQGSEAVQPGYMYGRVEDNDTVRQGQAFGTGRRTALEADHLANRRTRVKCRVSSGRRIIIV